MESIDSRNYVPYGETSTGVCLNPELIRLHTSRPQNLVKRRFRGHLQMGFLANIEGKITARFITLLSVCHAPSVLATDRPIYAFLAGIRALDIYLQGTT